MTHYAPLTNDSVIPKIEIKKEIKEENDEDDDVDGIPMDETEDKIAEQAKMRSRIVPGGLAEPEQRDTVKLAVKIEPKKMIQRNTGVKKSFIVKKKRR